MDRCELCGRAFRRQNAKQDNSVYCPDCNTKEREMAVDRYSQSLIGKRLRRRRVLDSRDSVARCLKIRDVPA